MIQVNIRVYRADKHPDQCLRYVEGHRKVLEAYGVTQVTSANIDWMHEPFSYIISVESAEDHRPLGGARIQLCSGTVPLPIETAINDLDTNIYKIVREKGLHRTGEFCGAWNSREVAGYGIGSIILGRTCMAVIDKLNMGSLFAFASPASLRNCQRVGFRVLRSLGVNGIFYYPKEDLVATALIIDDPVEVAGATEENREKIRAFRENPIQQRLERGPKGEIEVSYDLHIDSDDIIKSPVELP
ncbi:MAG TPA: hypothetical protein VFX43_07475 [Chitinophagaceae bacterium]|nr:hypothetical protein [Chitinophagaceae bacterium]